VQCFPGAQYKSFPTLSEAQTYLEGFDQTVHCDEKDPTKLAKYQAPEGVVYTDGSCFNNGQPNAAAGAGVYFGDSDPRNLAEEVPGDQTNNRGEAYAILRALQETKGPLEIRSDSRYSIDCATRKKTARVNLDLFRQIWRICRTRTVTFTWLKGHNNDRGNDGADRLAGEAARRRLKRQERRVVSEPPNQRTCPPSPTSPVSKRPRVTQPAVDHSGVIPVLV